MFIAAHAEPFHRRHCNKKEKTAFSSIQQLNAHIVHLDQRPCGYDIHATSLKHRFRIKRNQNCAKKKLLGVLKNFAPFFGKEECFSVWFNPLGHVDTSRGEPDERSPKMAVKFKTALKKILLLLRQCQKYVLSKTNLKRKSLLSQIMWHLPHAITWS